MTTTTFFEAVTLKALPSGEISGIACRFGQADRVGDVILKGAFSNTIERMRIDKSVLPMMFEHGRGSFSDLPIGAWTSLTERAEGLFAKGQLEMSISGADRIVTAAQAGALFMSVAGIPRPTHGQAFLPGGAPNQTPGGRQIAAIDLLEISLTAKPVTYGTSVAIKSLYEHEDIRSLERQLSEYGLTRRDSRRAAGALWPILAGEETDDSAELHELGAALKTLTTSLRS